MIIDFYKKIKKYSTIPQISFIWIFLVYPLFYIDVDIWEKIARYRFVFATLLFGCYISYLNYKKFDCLILFPLIYVAQELVFALSQSKLMLAHNDIYLMYILSPLFLYASFVRLDLNSKNFNWFLFCSLVYSLFIFFYSMDNSKIIGLNISSRHENFNYLIPAYGLISIFLLSSLMGIGKYYEKFILLSVVTFIGLYSAGSRGALGIFILVFIFSLISHFKIRQNFFALSLISILVFALYSFSSQSIKNRYNIFRFHSDASYVQRVEYLNNFSSAGKNEDFASIGKNENIDLKVLSGEQVSDGKFNITTTDSFLSIIMGRKLWNPESVVNDEYNHTVISLILNNGLLFLSVFMLILIRRLYVFFGIRRSFFIISSLSVSFLVLADLFIVFWALTGLLSSKKVLYCNCKLS